MKYRSQTEPYIIDRRGGRDKSTGAFRAAGVLVGALVFLTAAICLLALFLPKLVEMNAAPVGTVATGGKTFYFLCTAESEGRTQALMSAQSAVERGGAGYIYNDGKYKIVAAAYERETDVKSLEEVNPDSYYFSLDLPRAEYASGDRAVIDYLCGEWFDITHTAATELDRGNTTDAAAEHAVQTVANRLLALSLAAENAMLRLALSGCVYRIGDQTKSVQVNIRGYMVQTLISGIEAISRNI